MRCTKHVFDLKVLLFIFLVESDPNFCGSGLAVAVLRCSASLSTLQTCRQCLTLVCNTQGRFLQLLPSPCRGVSLQTNQLLNGWFNYLAKRSFKPVIKCKGPNKFIKCLLWMGTDYCTLQSSNNQTRLHVWHRERSTLAFVQNTDPAFRSPPGCPGKPRRQTQNRKYST